ITSIGGFNIAAGDVLVRYTFYGDADLNGQIDFDDYVRTHTRFNSQRPRWSHRDFNYDHTPHLPDYLLLDPGFNWPRLLRCLARSRNEDNKHEARNSLAASLFKTAPMLLRSGGAGRPRIECARRGPFLDQHRGRTIRDGIQLAERVHRRRAGFRVLPQL